MTTTIDLENIITELETRISDDCRAIDTEEQYNDMLDDCYSLEKVGGPFAHMWASRVLKEVDPVAYRCGLNDYVDSCEWVEVGSETYEQSDCEKVKDELLDELESMKSDLEDFLETRAAEFIPGPPAHECGEDKELAAVRSAIATLKKHSF